jgi:hypothetical protein
MACCYLIFNINHYNDGEILVNKEGEKIKEK